MTRKSESYAAIYSAGYRCGVKFGQSSMEDRELVNLRKDTAHYKAGYKDGTKKALKDIKLQGENKLSYNKGLNDGLLGAENMNVYAKGYRAGIKEGVGKEGHEIRYQAGYRAASRTAPKKAVEDTLTRLMDKVGKLGNHSSVLMVKHEIRKELEGIRHKEHGMLL